MTATGRPRFEPGPPIRNELAGAPGGPDAGFLREPVLDWLPAIERGLAADGADAATARRLATLTLAVIRGLLLDANATGDHGRVGVAFDGHAALLSSRAPGAGCLP